MKFRHLYALCPLCDSPIFTPFARASCKSHASYREEIPEIMTWMKCQACSHLFTDGYFTEAALELIFSNTQNGQIAGVDLEAQRFVSARMISRVARHRSSGTWLDVGFGNGSLMLTALEFGYEAIGLDLRRDNVEGMKQLGFNALCSDIETLDHPGRYAVISMADVLEHMPFPRNGLQAAHRLLDSHGVILVSMPNASSPAWDILTKSRQNPYWGEIEHYHNFTKDRLYGLLRQTGFEPVEYGVSERYRMCMEVIARRIG